MGALPGHTSKYLNVWFIVCAFEGIVRRAVNAIYIKIIIIFDPHPLDLVV